MEIILASRSPRREKLLEGLIGKSFIVRESAYKEDNDADISPVMLAEKHAIGKARDVASHFKEGIVIAADSIVVLDGKVLGKPKDEKDAVNMLARQSGQWTEVITGLAVIDIGKKEYIEHETTKVKMMVMSDAEIAAYVATGDPMDKAGAFGIQSRGAAFVEKIYGCYSNVVGLPVPRLLRIMREMKVEVFR